eukprot:s405_g5.t1
MGGMSSTPSEMPKKPTLNDDHSINWKEILADPRFDWMTYDPPQKKAGYGGISSNFYFFQPRACIGSYPPCCIAQCLQSQHGYKKLGPCPFLGSSLKIEISKADDWLPQFLERGNEDLPDSFRGVWWLEDNTANETLVTVQDMNIFIKDQSTNWTQGTSLWGTMLKNVSTNKVPFELEPGENPKWLGMLTGDDFIYFLGEEDAAS